MGVYRLGQPAAQPPFPATEPLATFDLTPASGDGMVFNLTPVPDQVGVGSPVNLQQTGQYSQARPPAAPPQYGTYTAPGLYSAQLSNTISAMTFSPTITPDFTGLLPPPPPSPPRYPGSGLPAPSSTPAAP